VIVLALIAVLIHLRHADREDAVAVAEAEARAVELAATERAEADERAGLRRKLAEVTAWAEAEVTGSREAASRAVAVAEAAQSEAEALAGQVQDLTRKLAGLRERQKPGTRNRKRTATGSRKAGSTAAAGSPATGTGAPPATGAEELQPPPGLSAEELVLWWYAHGKNPSRAGILAGLSDSRGRQIIRDKGPLKAVPSGGMEEQAG
jgi:hypothetical protein